VSGGTTVSTMVTSSGFESVYSGSISTTAEAGGILDVFSSGRTSDSTVNAGGSETILARGGAISTTLSAGGFQVIWNGGVARDTVMDVGATIRRGVSFLHHRRDGKREFQRSVERLGWRPNLHTAASRRYTLNYALSPSFFVSNDIV
jgi:autotransporter passenger strand-loop-strand repeat protein